MQQSQLGWPLATREAFISLITPCRETSEFLDLGQARIVPRRVLFALPARTLPWAYHHVSVFPLSSRPHPLPLSSTLRYRYCAAPLDRYPARTVACRHALHCSKTIYGTTGATQASLTSSNIRAIRRSASSGLYTAFQNAYQHALRRHDPVRHISAHVMRQRRDTAQKVDHRQVRPCLQCERANALLIVSVHLPATCSSD
ncbi:hypothetical protein OH76DRAFT_134783 [Lentinus brumalis]|uniref:Uncharacterized protein n=1 Tax=Lentinus brumalis TaxID=2498619 RepID=A0A371DK76_9APHY|nr:hypothetical protein OH76DRAFT_134783 [Polyporus brumalis]